MKKLFLFLLLFLIKNEFIAQNNFRQANTIASEIFADAPYRMKKLDSNGNIQGIPIIFVCHDADGTNANNELIEINIRLKNAKDTVFGEPISFFSYSDEDFYNLFSYKSKENIDFNIQAFDTSSVLKDPSSTLNFVGETNLWIPPLTYLNIDKKWWYFVFTIPSEIIQGYDDIIDLYVEFNLDYSTDEHSYLRVFRETNELPKIANWYRGDTHYHTFFTQNTAEYGHPIEPTSFFAKKTGIDWITTTDHSCDFDNYGVSATSNWNELGNQIQELNSLDSTFKFIRGIEISANNSDGSIVHGLVYPSENEPLSLPYIADGGGDLSGTSINIDMMLDSCIKYNAFCYAAHPFSEGDKLSATIGGNVWNLNDPNFPENGNNHPSIGSVICNDLNAPSDILSSNPQQYYKEGLAGGQLLNLLNSLSNADEFLNPWNVEYDSSIDNFSELDSMDYMQYMYRYIQNFDVYLFSLQKGLLMKNTNNISNWKWFQSAGSDAHGSFNYSNTDYTFGFIGGITNNAIGRLSTLAYCPEGMGENGNNILKALRNGQTVLSDGPIITFSLEHFDGTNQIIIGSDSTIESNDFQNYYLKFFLQTSMEFGNFSSVWLTLITQDTIVNYNIEDFHNGDNYLKLDSLLLLTLNPTPENQYFSIILSANTEKMNETNPHIFGMNKEKHFCTTNPIWLRKDMTTDFTKRGFDNVIIYPNPFDDYISISNYDNKIIRSINVFDIRGNIIEDISTLSGQNKQLIHTENWIPGIYILRLQYNDGFKSYRIVKL